MTKKPSNKSENQRRYRAKNKDKVSELEKEYYENNKERISQYYKLKLLKESEEERKARLDKNKAYKAKNRNIINTKERNMSDEKREHKNKLRRISYQANIEINRKKKREYARRLKHDSLNHKLISNIRVRLWYAVKNKSCKTIESLGCSIPELKSYLESKFLPGMTWESWSRDGWHIDHIIPLSSFDLTNREELLKACHYSNLQPLWAKDNLSKSNKTTAKGNINESSL